MKAHHHTELLAGLPERVVAAVVVVRKRRGEVGNHGATQARGVRDAQFLDGEFHVPQQWHHCHAEMPRRRLRAKLRKPAVVGTRASPLQIRRDVFGGQAQSRAEGRRVHLGDAVDEYHLTRDPVGIEHADALAVIPGAGELLLDARAPLVVDFLDQEGFFGGLDALGLQRVGNIENLAQRRIDVIAVHVARQAGVAIGGDDDVAVHEPELLHFAPLLAREWWGQVNHR